MAVKRIISDEKKATITGSKAHKGKDITTMTAPEKDDLLKIVAEKLGLL
jgi:hypothetical protein